MGLFDKKTCSICGDKIGLLGNRKLEDGNMCKDCASLLSPFFSDRKNSTVEEIKEQLKYREENAVQIKSIMPDKVFGDGMKVYVDTKNNKFFVTSASNWKDANPDIIDFSQLISCDVEVVEEKEEIFQEDDEGNEKSFNPKKYEYSYRFEAVIRVNSPWFDEIDVELADGDYPDSRFTEKYHNLESELYELKSTLTGVKELAPQEQIKEGITQVFNTILGSVNAKQNANAGGIVNNVTPQDSWKCECGATNTGNFCPSCGAKKPVQQLGIRCDKCGWTAEPGQIPKFCPNCGDPIDANDLN